MILVHLVGLQIYKDSKYIFFGLSNYTTLICNIKNYKNIFIGKNTQKYKSHIIYTKIYKESSIFFEIKKNN
jgi:hypothetical protein